MNDPGGCTGLTQRQNHHAACLFCHHNEEKSGQENANALRQEVYAVPLLSCSNGYQGLSLGLFQTTTNDERQGDVPDGA